MLHFYRPGRGTTWPGEKADEGGEDGQETRKEEDEALVDVGLKVDYDDDLNCLF